MTGVLRTVELLVADRNDPFFICTDKTLSIPPPPSDMSVHPPLSCTIPRDAENQRPLKIGQACLSRFHQKDGRLNDECINVGAQVFLQHFGTADTCGHPAIFPSWTFSMHQDGKTCDDALWRVTAGHARNFWEMDIWLVPIHRAETQSWALAVVYWRKRRIAYFNSYANSAAFECDVKIMFALLHRLQRLIGEHGYRACNLDGQDWYAYPLVSKPLQRNSYDSGVWVLACLAAILRGYTSVKLSSKSIADFRLRVVCLIYTAAGHSFDLV